VASSVAAVCAAPMLMNESRTPCTLHTDSCGPGGGLGSVADSRITLSQCPAMQLPHTHSTYGPFSSPAGLVAAYSG
jgi:hypothetical protein